MKLGIVGSWTYAMYDYIKAEDKFCPFCGTLLKQEYHFERYDCSINTYKPIIQQEFIYCCENDGWWTHKILDEKYDPRCYYIIHHEGILTTYPEDSPLIPINVLNDYILDHPRKIQTINDRKMEELVASVFASFYHCETRVIGKSSDGGVDVVLVDGDNPTMIQVKRRQNSHKAESVCYIRELIGATLLKGAKRCMFVTTAPKFSPQCYEAADQAVQRGLVEKYDLIDCSRFISIIKSEPRRISHVWDKMKVLNDLGDKHYGTAFLDE